MELHYSTTQKTRVRFLAGAHNFKQLGHLQTFAKNWIKFSPNLLIYHSTMRNLRHMEFSKIGKTFRLETLSWLVITFELLEENRKS